MDKCKVGFALCGSYCTFKRVMPIVEQLVKAGYDVMPIMSENSYSTDTRFGTAESFIKQLTDICGKEPLHEIKQVEPIGPKGLIDVLVIAPCTGNTMAKIANGISDTSVTQAAKSHLRNGRPVIIAVSSNDALGANAKNLGILLGMRNIYFVPMKQDDPENKPRSIVAEMERIEKTIEAARKLRQIQPIIM